MSKKIQFRTNKTGTGFKLPPEGTFDLQIVEVKEGQPTKDNDPQIVVKFEIADGPHAGEKFRQYYTLNEERGWAFRALCTAAGLEIQPEDEDGDLATFEVDTDELLERFVRATIVLNKNQASGKTFVNLRDEQPSTLTESAGGGDEASDERGEDEDGDEPADEPSAEASPEPAPARTGRRAPPPEA